MAHITARLNEGLRVAINTAKHEWFADEPVTAGGTDSAPAPYELLLSSLAACTVMTLRLYTEHKGINVDHIEAEYQFARLVHEGDAGQGAPSEKKERITANITVTGVFDEAQKKRLEQIATRCPVHRTLAAGLEIVDYVTFVNPDAADAPAQEIRANGSALQ